MAVCNALAQVTVDAPPMRDFVVDGTFASLSILLYNGSCQLL